MRLRSRHVTGLVGWLTWTSVNPRAMARRRKARFTTTAASVPVHEDRSRTTSTASRSESPLARTAGCLPRARVTGACSSPPPGSRGRTAARRIASSGSSCSRPAAAEARGITAAMPGNLLSKSIGKANAHGATRMMTWSAVRPMPTGSVVPKGRPSKAGTRRMSTSSSQGNGKPRWMHVTLGDNGPIPLRQVRPEP